jgi:hypothetical protein
MTATETARDLDASIDIAAPADAVWRVVSDVRRTGEWSPECLRVVPMGGVRRDWFLIGWNHRGRTGWPTLSRITRFEPGTHIAWRVLTNSSVWSYTLQATGSGCALSCARRTPDGIGRFAGWFTRRYLGGQAGHDAELQAGMRTGLERIKSITES